MVGHSRTNIHYKLLKPNEKLNSKKYRQQLDNLKTGRKKRPAMLKRKVMILHHDNARCFRDSSENCRSRLGNSVAPAIFMRHSTLWLSLVFILTKFFEKIQKWRRCRTSTQFIIFRIKRWNIFPKWNIQIALKLATDR